MKQIIDAKGQRESVQALDAKLDAVVAALAERQESGGMAARLAEILRRHTPYSFFVSPSVAELTDWVENFFAVVSRRREVLQVALTRIDDNRAFLLSLTDDAPFLLHSLQMALGQLELEFQVVCHPILQVERRQDGVLTALGLERSSGQAESLIIIEIDNLAGYAETQISDACRQTLLAVQGVARDQAALVARVREIANASGGEQDFWNWLQDDNFLFFSYRQIRLGGEGETLDWALEIPDSALGLEWEIVDLRPGEKRPLAELSERFRGRMLRPTRIVVEEIDRRSPIYKDQCLTYIGVRTEVDGKPTEHAFLGLFTAKAVEDPTLKIEQLNQRIEAALETLSVPRGCHDYRKTLQIFNSFPKVELFFMSDEEILQIVRSFTHLYRHGAVKVVPAHSLTVRGMTLLVILPVDFYSKENVVRMEAFLGRFFRADQVTSHTIQLSGAYVSLHVTVQLEAFDLDFDTDRLERGLTAISRPWSQTLKKLLERRFEPVRRSELWRQIGARLPEEYQHLIHPRFAIRDLVNITELLHSRDDAFDLWGPFGGDEPFFRLQYYSLSPSYLNDLLPCLDNFHLRVIDEVDFVLDIDGVSVFIKSFSIRTGDGGLPLLEVKEKLLLGLTLVRQRLLENDLLNKLVVLTELDWRQVDVFRAYRNYYFQLGSPYTKLRVANALINNPQLATLLYRYFAGRFDPDNGCADLQEREEQALMPLRLELVTALEQVSDVNEDNILRILFNLIDSTVRTNFFVSRSPAEYFVSFKISAIGIIDMPAPRPLFETYVHSASMEGIHLRGGMVARGGIRWSDRPDDFRTEILGLMKTQMTKNALIVPVGSKGGFIVKTPYNTREEGGGLSKRAYQTLMRGLLDVTDNRVGSEIVHSPRVIALDDQDPYLVVAADKGTAHLSDTANAVSEDYGFWLKDAFASGGSKGYDHKKLGITARGAWECVKRHFREVGVDIQQQPVTVVGIGDMSGDVFGNGMLLSRAIKLVAAFDHRHIFLDPDPDPERSWQERQRLFELPRSSWDDYNRELISAGGGVFPRSLKEIPLSTEVQHWLGIRHSSIDPPGLISLLLGAEVDMLWNGGIGTYVKASSEKHQDAGDRANDGLRIDATRLRVKVVGEGGNLGMTQRARIEYAIGGGRINTDAIDNSAGVDCSDHEVNLKIFLHHLMERGTVADGDQRDSLLEAMTEEVSVKVLANNYTQSLCLSLDQLRCQQNVGAFLDLISRLTDAGLLDRQGELLPGTKEVMARTEAVLTRPELSKLLAYGKMQLYQALLESDLDLVGCGHSLLVNYFPNLIQQQFPAEIADHPLGREITATMITNYLVDTAGAAFCNNIGRATGAALPEIAVAFLTADQLIGAAEVRKEIYALDNRLPAERQHQLLLRLEDSLAEVVLWSLNNGFSLSLSEAELATLQQALEDYLSRLEVNGSGAESEEFSELGLTPGSVRLLARLPLLHYLLPVVSLARQSQVSVVEAADCHHAVRQQLEIEALLQGIARVAVHDQWDRLAASTLTGQFEALVYDLVAMALSGKPATGEAVPEFFAKRQQNLKQVRVLRQQLLHDNLTDLHPYVVLLGSMRRLAV